MTPNELQDIHLRFSDSYGYRGAVTAQTHNIVLEMLDDIGELLDEITRLQGAIIQQAKGQDDGMDN